VQERIATGVGLFVATNIDDLVLLTLWFGRARRNRRAELAVVAGQYLGLAAIVAVSVAAALGATLLPAAALPWLGLVPIGLGLRAGLEARRERREGGEDGTDEDGTDDVSPTGATAAGLPTAWSVAAVTAASGGDNVGVYVPVLANAPAAALGTVAAVFAVMVPLWCALAAGFARHPTVARALARWGDVALPVVLVAIGVWILVEGLAG
jgi:cadmium resistance protein CadD (predicted permease)